MFAAPEGEEESLEPVAEEEPPLAPAVAAWAVAETFDEEPLPDEEFEPLALDEPVEEPTEEVLDKGVEPDFSDEFEHALPAGRAGEVLL